MAKAHAQLPALTYYPYPTPHGIITIAAADGALSNIAFGTAEFAGTKRPSELTNAAANQLQEYFAGKRFFFDVPLAPEGTSFQLSVWEAVAHIPYGKTATCTDIARALGDESAYRAVGAAVNKNPLPILIPTHRIVAANGKPFGSAATTQAFAGLLKAEQSYRP